MVGAERRAPQAAAVGQFDPGPASRPADDVGGREHQAVGGNDHAAAGGVADFDRGRGGQCPFEHALELVLDAAQIVDVDGRPGGQGDGRFRAGGEGVGLLCQAAARASETTGDEGCQDDAASGIHA